jgi:hypothetical protein
MARGGRCRVGSGSQLARSLREGPRVRTMKQQRKEAQDAAWLYTSTLSSWPPDAGTTGLIRPSRQVRLWTDSLVTGQHDSEDTMDAQCPDGHGILSSGCKSPFPARKTVAKAHIASNTIFSTRLEC